MYTTSISSKEKHKVMDPSRIQPEDGQSASQTVPPPSSSMSIPPKKSSKKLWWSLGILFVLVAVGCVAWYLMGQSGPSSSNQLNGGVVGSVTESSKGQRAAALDKTYTDKTGNFSVKYPSTWKVETSTGVQGRPENPTTNTTLTSPGGTVLVLKSDWGGRGGVCDIKAGDKPFAAGNACASQQILTAETLPINNVYYAHQDAGQASGQISYSYKPTAVVLVTTHFADQNGKSQYSVGVTSWDSEGSYLSFSPTMGALSAYPWVTVYGEKGGGEYPLIYAYALAETADFLTRDDVSTIKDILRTLTINI